MLHENGLSCNASKLLSFSFDLYKRNPWSLGLDPDEVYELSERYGEDDHHLSKRLNWLSWQVRYAVDYDKTKLTYPEWHPCEDALQPGESIPFIHPKHYQEWLDSGISPLITILNLQSYHDPKHVINFLGYYRSNSPGWICWGVNPFTGVTDETVATHCKPDKPYRTKDGKLAKYLCPNLERTGKEIDLVFLNTGIEGYWKDVLYSDKPIIVTEGVKKSASGLSNLPEVPTVASLGTWMAVDKVEYYDPLEGTDKTYTVKKRLKDFINRNKPIYIAFDSDAISKDSVSKAVTTLGESIEKAKGQAKVIVWDYSPETKGMDDLIHSQGIEAFKTAFSNALSLEGYIDWIEDKKLDKEVEELKKDIADWDNETDSARKHLKERRLIKKYGLDWQGKRLAELSQSTKSPKNSLTLLDAIKAGLEDESPDIEWLLPNYFARGSVSLVAGKAGVGKSITFYNLLIALAEGTEFLGQNIDKPYKSLWLAMDEPFSSWKKKAISLGLYGHREHLRKTVINFVHRKHYQWICNPKRLSELETHVKELGIDFIGIDCLKKILPPGLDINSVDVESQVIAPLSELAERCNIHIAILHHLTKEEGVKNIRGSGAILDSLNYAGTLSKANDKLHWEDVKQRDSDEFRTVSFTLDKSNYSCLADITVKGDTSQDDESESKPTKVNAKEKVIDAINDFVWSRYQKGSNPHAKDKSEVQEKTQVIFKSGEIKERVEVKPTAFTDALNELVEEGMLNKVKQGYYTITDLFDETYL